MNIKTILLLDWETHPDADGTRYENERLAYKFPWWIDWQDLTLQNAGVERWVGDFSDLLAWALEINMIEDYCLEEREGWVLVDVVSTFDWSQEKEDVVETVRGRLCFTFREFLSDFITEAALLNFLKIQLLKSGKF